MPNDLTNLPEWAQEMIDPDWLNATNVMRPHCQDRINQLLFFASHLQNKIEALEEEVDSLQEDLHSCQEQ